MYDQELVGPALAAVREACLGLPEVTERLSHGSPSFFVRGTTTFVMFLDNHHDDGRLAVWCAAPAGVQAQLVEQEPDRFFRPPYVGHRGWIGVRLDVELDPDELGAICEDAYRHVAPRNSSPRSTPTGATCPRPGALTDPLDSPGADGPGETRPMLRHAVMFRWSPATTDDDIAAIRVGLGALPGLIAEIRAFHFGPDAGINDGNYDFAVVGDFDTAADYLVYRDHPEHRSLIAERIAAHIVERAAVQFETTP